ncbi:MAG: hypothetical protein FD176_1339 [Rhodospirillaceae bacterium]|nr:MAG: hypothetical protein FD176_1339 [Rhodospirillaceae bacterium]TNC94250.1 MAG: Membrane protein [Stygiobacter sp.]
MTAVLVAVLIPLAMAGLGWPLVRRLVPGLGEGERLALAPLLGALPLSALVQAVGAWRYDFAAMAAVLAVALAFVIGLPRSVPPFPWRWWPWGWLLAALFGLLALSALAPPIDHDTIRYHLTLPRRDLELGRIALWFGWSIYEFFPPLASLLTRLAFALGGAEAAQMLNVVWVGLTAIWAGLLVRRLGCGPQAALAAALLVVGQRVTLNLGSGVTTDFPLAAFIGAAVTVALSSERGKGAVVALGLLLGAAMACKYQGIFAALAVLVPLGVLAVVRRRGLGAVIGAGLVAALVLAPILLRNYAVTGNPVFPTAHPLFVAGGLDVFAPFTQAMTRQTIPGGPWALPWTMFILQDAFDGLQWGFPFILLGLPFAFFRPGRARLILLAMVALYVALWWLVMPHLLRFLLPMLVPFCALGAAGLAQVAGVAVPWFRPVFTAAIAVGMVAQALFAGSSALYRLPVVFGLLDIRQALEVPAFRYYSLISPCLWLEEKLKPEQTYLALVNDPSFYCPQKMALHGLRPGEERAFYTVGVAPLSAAEIARWLRRDNVRYILMVSNLMADDERYAFAKHRFDHVVAPLLAGQHPLLDSPSGRVYDAVPLIAALERASGQ